MKKTITGSFPTQEMATLAVRRLEGLGIDQSDISVAAPHDPSMRQADEAIDDGAQKGAGAGAILGGAGGMVAAATSLAIPGLGPVLAAGWLATTIGGAITGGAIGGAAGGLVASVGDGGDGEGEDCDRASIEADLARGRTVVAARVDEQIAPAVQRLLEHPS